jgi:tRNA(fMet)-specific endonuclease VapC
MTTYALDTNIVSFYLRNNLAIINRIDIEKNNNNIVIPPLVYYEIKNWLLKNDSKKKIAIFEKMYLNYGIDSIDKNNLDIASTIKIQLETKGIIIGDNDILIAAYCLKNNYILVTNNTKHFKDIDGLTVDNWN